METMNAAQTMNAVGSWSDSEADESEWREWHESESKQGDGWSHGFVAYDWTHLMGRVKKEKKEMYGDGHTDQDSDDDGDADTGQGEDGGRAPPAKKKTELGQLFVHEPRLEVVRHFTLENWTKMGDAISHNAYLKCVDFSHCGLRAESITALFGPGRNYDNCAIEKLTLAHNPIGPGGVGRLLPFLKSRPSSLSYLGLSSTHLGPIGTRLLSEALDHVAVDCLHVRDNNIGDEGVESILSAENSVRILELCLVENELGPRGYESIRLFLQRDDTAMKKLMLDCPDGTDAKMILDALSENTILQDIFVWGGTGRDNESMKMALPNLQTLVCGGSSLESVVDSNHQMKWIGINTDSILASHPRIRKALDINARGLYGASELEIVRCKLREFYFRGDFDVHPFVTMEAKLMPNVLEMVTRTEICTDKGGDGYLHFGTGTYTTICSETIDGVYRLVRNCHLPELFSFPRPKPSTTQLKSNRGAETDLLNAMGRFDEDNEVIDEMKQNLAKLEVKIGRAGDPNSSPNKRRKSEL